jgi:type I restriction enzyme S subunit
VGRAAIWDYDYNIMIQNHIHRLRGKVDICTRYFFYLFMHYKLHNLIGGKGVAIQGLSSRDLHNLIIPVHLAASCQQKSSDNQGQHANNN